MNVVTPPFANAECFFYCLSINGVLLPTPRSQVTLSFKYLLAIVHKMLLLLRKCMG